MIQFMRRNMLILTHHSNLAFLVLVSVGTSSLGNSAENSSVDLLVTEENINLQTIC